VSPLGAGRKRREDFLGAALLAAALVVIAARGAGAALLLGRRVRTDARDCPADGPPAANAVLVYDASDRLAVLQREWVEARIAEWTQKVPRHGRLRIFPLVSDPEALAPSFDRCNPGAGEDESFWTANPAKRKRRFEALFAAPAESAVRGLAAGQLAQSPLLESLQLLAVRGGLEPGQAQLPRSLLLVSDLLQHSAAVSHYTQGCRDAAAFVGSEAFGRLRGNLRGLEVEVLHLYRERPAGCSVSDQLNWWDAVLEASGADLVSVKQAPGTAPSDAGPP
jgi:hypothetical protein